jgi:hypothetical protein
MFKTKNKVIALCIICFAVGLIAKDEERIAYYSFDSLCTAYVEKGTSGEFTLTISSDEKGYPIGRFGKRDLNLPTDTDDFTIDHIRWAKKGHEIMAVQISAVQWTDIKLIYLDKNENKWELVNLGPPIGYFEPEWIKEDKILVTFAGSEDDYAICVFNFEKHIVTYLVPYRGRINYNCQGIVIFDGGREENYISYDHLSSFLDEPKIGTENLRIEGPTDIEKEKDFVFKVASFVGNERRYLNGKDFYYHDFVGYVDIPIRDNCKFISYPLPTKEKGLAGLKKWNGYQYLYSFGKGFQFKGYKMITSEDEELLKNLEKERMEVKEVPICNTIHIRVGSTDITAKEVPKNGEDSECEIEIKIKNGKKYKLIKLQHYRPNNNSWWTPIICVEKDEDTKTMLMAIKYINDKGICTDIYAIKR